MLNAFLILETFRGQIGFVVQGNNEKKSVYIGWTVVMTDSLILFEWASEIMAETVGIASRIA